MIAAAARLTMLCGLGVVGHIAAIGPNVGSNWDDQLPNPNGMIEYLQKRVYYRPLAEDEIAYDEMARNIVSGRGFVLDRIWQITTPGEPAMFAGCGYPLFVAGVYKVFGTGSQLPVFLIQILSHSLAAGFIAVTAKRVAGPIAGAVAGAFYSLHPMLIWSSVAMMSEAVVVPLVCVLFWLLTCRNAFNASVQKSWWRIGTIAALLATLCLTRSTFSYFVPVTLVLLVWEGRRFGVWTHGVKRMVAFALVFVAICAPWTIRNYVHFGKFVPFSTKRGCAAYVFNHDGLKAEFGPAAVGGPQPINLYGPEMAALPDEMARDEKCMQMFLQFVQEKPGKFLSLCWIRFWMAILPVAITAHSKWAVVAGWYIKGFPLALLPLGLLLARKRLWFRTLPVVLFVTQGIALQSVSGAGMRYRLPNDPAWALLVGVLSAVIFTWLSIGSYTSPLANRWLRRGTAKEWQQDKTTEQLVTATEFSVPLRQT